MIATDDGALSGKSAARLARAGGALAEKMSRELAASALTDSSILASIDK
jgi:hypothetical protein